MLKMNNSNNNNSNNNNSNNNNNNNIIIIINTNITTILFSIILTPFSAQMGSLAVAVSLPPRRPSTTTSPRRRFALTCPTW